MNHEDKLRDAFRRGGPRATPSATSWDDVRTRAHSIHRRRRATQAGLALVAVAAMTVGVFAATGSFDHDTSRSIVATPSQTSPGDGEIVAALDHSIVVLSASDGHVIRTIVDGLDEVRDVAVTPDGRTVYFSRGTQLCTGGAGSLARVPVAGGTPKDLIGAAGKPTISPDGRWLAYMGGRCDIPGEFLDYEDLTTQTVYQPMMPGVPPSLLRSAPIGWSSDSQSLVLLSQEPDGSFSVSRLDELRGPWTAPVPLAKGLTNVVAGSVLSNGTQLIASQQGDSYLLRTIAERPGGLAILAQGRSASPVAEVAASPSGSRFLLRFADGTLALQEPSGEPRTIATGVHGAAWLPRATTAPTPTSVPPTMAAQTSTTLAPAGHPATVVALTQKGELVELDSSDGHRLRVLTQLTPEALSPALALTPNGSTIYVDQAVADSGRGCGLDSPLAGDIVSVDRASGQTETIAKGRWPAVSPDGGLLAYVKVDRCDQLPRLAVRNLQTGDERSWSLADPGDGGPQPALRGPLSFAPDSKHLVGRVQREPGTQLWEFDVTTAGDAITGRMIPTSPGGPNGSIPIADRYLGSTGLLVVGTFGDVPDVYAIDPATGEPAGIIFGTSGVVNGEVGWSVASADPAGRNLLLLVRTGTTTYLERGVVRDGPEWTGAQGPPTRIGPDGIVAATWGP